MNEKIKSDLVTDIEFCIWCACPGCDSSILLGVSQLPEAIYSREITCTYCRRILRVDNFPSELLKLAPRGVKYRKHKWLEKRHAKGLCTRCGGKRDDKTKKSCSSCRKKYQKYNRRKKVKSQ